MCNDVFLPLQYPAEGFPALRVLCAACSPPLMVYHLLILFSFFLFPSLSVIFLGFFKIF